MVLKDIEKKLESKMVIDAKLFIAKNAIRELEESTKGTHIAFVDDGDHSYDVLLSISAGKITKHQCDCLAGEKGEFCKHKCAVALKLQGVTSVKERKVRAKKLTELELIFQEKNFQEIQAWMIAFMEKNKDVKMAFIQHFSQSSEIPSIEEIIKKTKEIKSIVVKNKKNIDQTELKKIIELWSQYHMPILKLIQNEVYKEENLNIFQNIIEICKELGDNFYTNSNKVDKYVESVIDILVGLILILKSEEDVKKAILYLISIVINHFERRNFYYWPILDKLLVVMNPNIQIFLVDNTLNIFSKKIGWVKEDLSRKLLPWVIDYDTSNKYISNFDVIPWQNDHNFILIDHLILIEKYDKAEKLIKKAINFNYKVEYSVPYMERLIQILEKTTKDVKQILALKQQILPYTFRFEDFMQIYESFEDPNDARKFRNTVYTRAANRFTSEKAARNLCVEILVHENKFDKLMDHLKHKSGVAETIIRYFDQFMNVNKKRFLEILMKEVMIYDFKEDDIDDIASLIKQKYTEQEIKLEINKEKFYYSSYGLHRIFVK